MKGHLRALLLALALSGPLLMAQNGPRNLMNSGNREVAYGGRVFRWNGPARAFVPRSELPPLFRSAAGEGIQDSAWDGEWAYRVIATEQGRELQSGLAQHTQYGLAWFWRPGIAMPPRSTLVVAAGRRAILRQEEPAAEGSHPEKGKLKLVLLDLVGGGLQVIDEQPGNPSRLSVAGCVLDGDLFCFWGSGRILKLTSDSQSVRVESENFWLDLPWEVAPVGYTIKGRTIYDRPSHNQRPFFTADGSIVLCLNATRIVPQSLQEKVSQEYDAYFNRQDAPTQQLMRERNHYPIPKESKDAPYQPDQVFLEWDPTHRKIRLVEEDRCAQVWTDCILVDYGSPFVLKGFHALKGNPAGYQFDADGWIQSLESLLKPSGPANERPPVRPSGGATAAPPSPKAKQPDLPRPRPASN